MFRGVNLVIHIVLIGLGLLMGSLGMIVLVNGPQHKTEWTIGLMSLLSAILLFLSAYRGFKKEKQRGTIEEAVSATITKKYRSPHHHVPAAAQPARLALAPENLGNHNLYVRWLYPANEWRIILQKLKNKTLREECYTAVWIPVLFGFVFFKLWYIGVALGIVAAWLYLRFRVYFVAKKFGLPATNTHAEVVITDAYLLINGNFIHYADGYYFVKNMALEQDKAMGDLLHFTIGWVTSKGYHASMDLYLPIPQGKMAEAQMTLNAYSSSNGKV